MASRANPLATLVGAALGAAAAVAVTSESGRRTRAYWAVADSVATPALRWMDAERAHAAAVFALRSRWGPVAPRETAEERHALRSRVFAREFAHPVGLPAGFDKQATAFEGALDMGFSFVEVGGVTPKPQPGNARPRMWRLPQDRAVINRFGLNSDGHDAVAARLAARDRDARPESWVGVNLAKNTDSAELVADYVEGVRRLGPLVDFIVLNVSCPNVGWTRGLAGEVGGGASGHDDDDGGVKALVRAVRRERDRVCAGVPVLLKLGPDMDEGAMRKMAAVALECGVDGLVLTNTTTARDGLAADARANAGGLSGAPLRDKALRATRELYRLTGGAVPIIGVGGISSARDAYERIRAGASLVQIYTALVYEGPGLVNSIRRELPALLRADGFENVADAVGADVRLEESDSFEGER